MSKHRLLTALVASLCIAGGAFGEAIMHARISAESGGALIRGSEDADWSYATMNTLVLPGDTVWADERGAVEMEMHGGSFVRFADKSKAEIAGLPPQALIRGWSGSFYVQRLTRSTGDVTFATPAAEVRIDRDSMVRVDIVGEGSTTVSVRWGSATIETTSGRPVALGRNQRVYIDPGLLPSTPFFFDATVDDDFDLWNREQARLLALGDEAYQGPINEPDPPMGITSLAGYGDWVTIDSQPYWRPTVVVDYVPYRVGYWSYVPGCGHVWVGSHPFSYLTSHYGRWIRHPDFGWCWTYRRGWSPAWVVSYRYGPNYVWAPLDIYDRPVTYGEARFRIGDADISIAVSSYCSVNDLAWGPAIVYPVQPQIVNVNVVHQEIHVWNLGDGYRSPSIVRPEGDGRPILPVRNYSPRRVIRGPEAGGGSGLVARTRVAALEQGVNRGSWRAAAAPGSRGLRTSVNSGNRDAQVRMTRVVPEARQQAESVLQRADRSGVGIRSRDAATRSVDQAITPDRTLGNIGGDRVTRRTDGVDRSPRTVTPDSERDSVRATATERPASTERENAARVGSGRGGAGGAPAAERVQTPSPRQTPQRESGPVRDRTPDLGVERPSRSAAPIVQTPVPESPRERRTEGPNRGPATQQRMESRPIRVTPTPAPQPPQTQFPSRRSGVDRVEPGPGPTSVRVQRPTAWQRPATQGPSASEAPRVEAPRVNVPSVNVPSASRNARPTRISEPIQPPSLPERPSVRIVEPARERIAPPVAEVRVPRSSSLGRDAADAPTRPSAGVRGPASTGRSRRP